MKHPNFSLLADRLLYGPDRDDRRKGLVKISADNDKGESVATSPTVANASPTASNVKPTFSATQSGTTSPTTTSDFIASSPNETQSSDLSTTSSPTLADPSPVDLRAKHQYIVHEVETSSPTSAETNSDSDDDGAATNQISTSDECSPNAPTSSTQRQPHPAIQAWKFLWSRPLATWHPTAFQLRPLIGILGLCIAIACAFASLSVLMVSDGQPTEDWPVSPAVLLAIITAAANSAIALAYMEAVPIAFWHSLMRGRTVRSLEQQWQVSRSILYAVAKMRHLSALNIACIAVALVVIDGPLLQRASTVERATQMKAVMLDLRMVPEIPSDFTGAVTNHLLEAPNEVLMLFPEYTTDEPMHLDVEGCDGRCSTTIQGPGVSNFGCSEEVWPITPEMLRDTNASWGEWRKEEESFGAPATQLPAFEVSVTPIYGFESSAAMMRVGYATWVELTGNYTMTTCTLVPAIAEYDVVIENGVVQIPKTPNQGRIIHLANNTRAVDQSPEAMPLTQYSAMDAVTVDTGLVTNSNASFILAHSSAPSDTIYAVYSLTYNLFTAQHAKVTPYFYETDWVDPTADIVFVANELMFRAGVIATRNHSPENLAARIDPGVEINQTVSATQERTRNVYKSDLRWYAGAAAVQIATALITLPMFWGWWRLGCNLTLSPFSIALAFDAPVLSDINSAAGTKGVVDSLGGMRLKYGAVESDEEKGRGTGFSGRLGVAESQMVFQPHAGMTFQR